MTPRPDRLPDTLTEAECQRMKRRDEHVMHCPGCSEKYRKKSEKLCCFLHVEVSRRGQRPEEYRAMMASCRGLPEDHRTLRCLRCGHTQEWDVAPD